MPDYVLQSMDRQGIPYAETADLDGAISGLDILYMTRIQRERFADPEQYERLKDSYVLTPEKMAAAKKTMAVLHPLPRVNEISVAVDADPRAAYFRQALNGKYMRMALILKLLDEARSPAALAEPEPDLVLGRYRCRNRRCICQTEQELAPAFRLAENGVYRCLYCETAAE